MDLEAGERIIVASAAGRAVTRVVGRRSGQRTQLAGGQQSLAMSQHALGVGSVQRKSGEELRGHAAAAAGVKEAAGPTGSAGLGLTQLLEQLRLAPHGYEPAVVTHV